MNHSHASVSRLITMQHASAYSTPSVQPKLVSSKPPMSGPSIIGTRRIMDCTPTPIVCRLLLSEVAMTDSVAGNDNDLHARNKNEPSSSASQCCQTKTKM